MTLLPFNPAAICPKCGHDVVATFYHAENSCWHSDCPGRHDGEHIKRLCTRYYYEWIEAVLNPEKEANP